MKKILSTFLIISILLSLAVTVSANNNQNNINPIQSFDYAGEDLIPIRKLENFGFLIEWSTTEERIYLSRPNSQITEFFINNSTIPDTYEIAEMNPTMTPFGNVKTFNINGNGYMYLNDLKNFAIVDNDVITINKATTFNIKQEENVEYLKGYTTVSKDVAKQWAKNKGATQDFINAADLYWKYAILTGLRAEVMYAQAAYETGFGTYKGKVVPSQNNFAGIKTKYATGDNTYDHETFASQEDGVRGHFNHMLAYTGGTPIGEPHGRYYSVKSMQWAGTVEKVEDLSGKWCPRANYSTTILKFLSEMYGL